MFKVYLWFTNKLVCCLGESISNLRVENSRIGFLCDKEQGFHLSEASCKRAKVLWKV